ncbi:MAG: tetratricopeptide repeat protein [Bacteroidetes bacterium]|jgi:serine/threonine-protein kinase|nr:tetratricopeptide repeat protein [Bacteroidota bacterium]
MATPSWERIQDVFSAVADLPTGEREAALRTACTADDGTVDEVLYEEVASLLTAHDEATAFMDASAEATLRDASGLPLGTQIGPYRLIRPLGRGGTGTVYLAWQRSPSMERRVAIKLIRPGLDDETTRQRFSLEQQVLADLHHPHIARLYDAGVTEMGRPYTVMAFVEGAPLDTYSTEQNLSLRERLALFLQVCDAVHHAHSNLVLHRDLKPSNILVTSAPDREGPGQAQLLDFGLAKLLAPDTKSNRTATQHRALTPPYASPEQLRGDAVTTATDVYSLGVVLYELLTGTRPFDYADASPATWERIVRKEPPPAPSTVAADTPVPSAALAGDLDKIVLKALRKEPERRYGSVRELADDIKRYLTGRPVTAREPTWRYRTTRFVQRNQTAVVAAVVAVLFLVGGASAALWQAGVAAAERDRAQTEQERAASTLELFIDVVGAANPSEEGNADVTVREVADETFAQIKDESVADEGTRRHLAEAVGRLYNNLGAYEQALEAFDLALQTAQDVYGPRSPEAARVLYRGVFSLIKMAKYDAAKARLFRIKDLVEEDNAAPDDPRWFSIYQSLAAAYIGEGLVRKAEDVLRAGLDLAEQYPGVQEDMVHSLMGNMANVYQIKRDFGGAIERHKELIELLESKDNQNHNLLITSKQNLSQSLQSKAGEQTDENQRAELLAESTHWLDAAMTLSENVYGRSHPRTASLIYRQGALFRTMGDTTKALETLSEALEIQRSVFPENHRATAFTLNMIGSTLHDAGKVDEALPYLTESLDMLLGIMSPDGAVIGSTRLGLAQALLHVEQYAQAEDHLLRAREIFEEQLGDQDSRFVETTEYLARLYEAWDKPEREAHFRALTASEE